MLTRVSAALKTELPWMAAYGILVKDLAQASKYLNAAALPVERTDHSVLTPYPEPLGLGFWSFVEKAQDLPWLKG